MLAEIKLVSSSGIAVLSQFPLFFFCISLGLNAAKLLIITNLNPFSLKIEFWVVFRKVSKMHYNANLFHTYTALFSTSLWTLFLFLF